MTIRIAIPDMVSPSYFPAIAAVELGFMEEQGLDASIELLGPVTATYEALRGGQIAYAGGAAHAPLYAFKDWYGCRLLCTLSQNWYWFLVLRADIAAEKGDLTALRGRRHHRQQGAGAASAYFGSIARRPLGQVSLLKSTGSLVRPSPRAHLLRLQKSW
jgi:NitT/TauT family transport system substrate-binding protein